MKASQLFDVSGQRVLITGAASGLGLAMAEALAETGALVIMADINEAALRASAAGLSQAGYQIETQSIDLADPQSVHAVVAEAAARHGRLDAVFANGGVSAGPGFGTPTGQIENVQLDLWESSMRVNLTGAFVTMQAAAQVMKKQRRGSIIVTTSVAALITSALPGYAYHAAKAGLAHVVRLAARELAPFNVRVNGLAPGPFPTNFAGGRMRDPQAAAAFAATVPMGRYGELSEIKGLALLLASGASSYLTGMIIPVDGGSSVA